MLSVRVCALSTAQHPKRLNSARAGVSEGVNITDGAAPLQVCVVVDKMDKLPREEVEKQLAGLGVEPAAINVVLAAMQVCTPIDR